MSKKSNEFLSVFNYIGIATVTARVMTISLIFAAFSGFVTAQTDEDTAAVFAMVEAYQHTYNTHDPLAFAKFYTEDADFLMFTLPEIHGRQAIENFWRRYWQSDFNKQEPERRGTFILNSVRFLANDVAIANIESITGGKDSLGVELQTRKARGTWLLHRQSESWLISSILGMPTEMDSVVLGESIETAKTLRPHIRAFVNAYVDAFNSHNPSTVSAFFRENADIIVRNSPLIQGKQAIQDWWDHYFSKPRNYKAVFIIDEIRTINDDVVQVNFTVTGSIPGTEDKLQPLRQTRGVWFLDQEGGEWRIDALRVLPGKDDIIIRR